MLIIAAVLAVVMGVTLGLLGGGGSILAVPLLVYVVGLDAKEAIATSLVVVGATSFAATILHARAGNVRWKRGLMFGGFAMAGAWVGGFAARWVPGPVLLALFGAMMVVAGIAMLRQRKEHVPNGPAPIFKTALEGLFVGAVTGLVGAGGGFIVVPALVLLGGLDMRSAVGTSALVITLKSFAGAMGHATHVTIDWPLAALIGGFAVVGSLGGVALACRISPARLRSAFAILVLATAGVMFFAEAPPAVADAIFVSRWPFWAGGLAIGLFVLGLRRFTGKRLGVSTGYMDVCRIGEDDARTSWRPPFMVGIVGGGTIAALLAGGIGPTMSMGLFDTVISSSLLVKGVVFTLGGVLVGFGARLAGGCTSGHGIVGIAQLAPSSWIATGAFMVAGFAITNVVFTAFGA